MSVVSAPCQSRYIHPSNRRRFPFAAVKTKTQRLFGTGCHAHQHQPWPRLCISYCSKRPNLREPRRRVVGEGRATYVQGCGVGYCAPFHRPVAHPTRTWTFLPLTWLHLWDSRRRHVLTPDGQGACAVVSPLQAFSLKPIWANTLVCSHRAQSASSREHRPPLSVAVFFCNFHVFRVDIRRSSLRLGFCTFFIPYVCMFA